MDSSKISTAYQGNLNWILKTRIISSRSLLTYASVHVIELCILDKRGLRYEE